MTAKVPSFPVRVPYDGLWLLLGKNGTLSLVFDESFARALHNGKLCYIVCAANDQQNAGNLLRKQTVLDALKRVPLGCFTFAAILAAYYVSKRK